MDTFALYLKLLIVLATALVVLISVKYLEIEEAHFGEYYALLLFSAVGMMFLASGTRSDRLVYRPGTDGAV